MSSVEVRTTGTPATRKRVRVEFDGRSGIMYSFRGPKSHRRVEVLVPHNYFMRDLEERALKIANARFRVIFGGIDFSEDDWKWATTALERVS
jgi:hypothetical protein